MTALGTIRKAAGFSQRTASLSLGIHIVHLSGVENGRNPASQALLAAMAALYHVPLTQVLEARRKDGLAYFNRGLRQARAERRKA